jgi:hypothetical protein
VQEDAGVICPLLLGDSGAVLRVRRAVENVVVLIDQPNCRLPVPDLLGPLSVGVISREPCKPGAQVEQAPVGDAVFIREAHVKREDLPAQAAAARGRVPPRGELVAASIAAMPQNP